MTEEQEHEAMRIAKAMVALFDPDKDDIVKLRALAFVVGASCLAANGGNIKLARRELKSIVAVAKHDMLMIVSDPHLHKEHGVAQ